MVSEMETIHALSVPSSLSNEGQDDRLKLALAAQVVEGDLQGRFAAGCCATLGPRKRISGIGQREELFPEEVVVCRRWPGRGRSSCGGRMGSGLGIARSWH